MASLVTAPIAPHVGDVVTLSLDEPIVTAVRWELASVPPRSALPLGPLLDARGAWTSALTPDVPGTYEVDAFMHERRDGVPARYPGDPAAEPRLVLLGSGRFELRVAAEMLLPVAAPLGGAVLTLSVVDTARGGGDMVGSVDAVVAARWSAPTTETARLAILSPEVEEATAALVGSTVAGLYVEVIDAAESLRVAYETHRVTLRSADEESGEVHVAADLAHSVVSGTPYSLSAALGLVPELRAALVGHLASVGAHAEPDTRNAPLATPGPSVGAAFVELVDLRYRVYARHLEQTAEPASHGASDTVHVLPPAMPLATALVAFLDALASRSPQLPDGEAQSAAKAGARFGFTPRRA